MEEKNISQYQIAIKEMIDKMNDIAFLKTLSIILSIEMQQDDKETSGK